MIAAADAECGARCDQEALGDIRTGVNDSRLQLVGLSACALCLSFCRIHFVDFAMQRATADAEFFRCGGDVAVGCCECLGNQSSFGLMKIERAGLFAERLGW